MQALRILVVEDEFIIATNLKLILEDLGYEPYEPVSNKKQAIQFLKDNEVDIAILDINLDGRHEGIEVGRFICENQHIPFIYLTSNADRATIDEAKQTRPNAYLIKPFTAEDIYAAIETAVAGNSPTPILQSEEEKLNILAESFFIKLGSKFFKVEINDITHFEADGKMMNLYTVKNNKFTIRTSMEGLLSQLKNYSFLRIHRSFCINTRHLDIINGEFVVVNQEQIPIGRNYRDELLGRIRTLS